MVNETTTESNVLGTLERLGFPMHKEGTVLYKDVIINASKSVSSILRGESKEDIFSLVNKLEETNSSFYREMADKKKIESNEFQSKINEAVTDIDKEKTDSELYKEIFCTKPNSFGEQVFYFALYLMGFSFKNETEETLKLEYN